MPTNTPWPPRYPSDFVPNEDSEYWDKELETMPPEQRDPIILEKLRSQIAYAHRNSGFYQDFYQDVSVDPSNIRSFEELAQLPILTKEDIRSRKIILPMADSCASQKSRCFGSTAPPGPRAGPRCLALEGTIGAESPRPMLAFSGALACALGTP